MTMSAIPPMPGGAGAHSNSNECAPQATWARNTAVESRRSFIDCR